MKRRPAEREGAHKGRPYGSDACRGARAPWDGQFTSPGYLALVRAFPLVHIRDDAHLDAVLVVFGPLFEQGARTPAEDAYLGALTDLIETYEDATVHIPPATGVDALRFLTEENGTTQAQLAPIFGTQSVVSEVLAGKNGRRLTVDQIKGLAAYYHVSPATFIV